MAASYADDKRNGLFPVVFADTVGNLASVPSTGVVQGKSALPPYMEKARVGYLCLSFLPHPNILEIYFIWVSDVYEREDSHRPKN